MAHNVDDRGEDGPERGRGGTARGGAEDDGNGDDEPSVAVWSRRRSARREQGVIIDEDYTTAMGASLWAMQQESLFTDVTVDIQGLIFHAHRAVLCAGSGLFRAMFTGGLRETRAQTAQIHDVCPGIFDLVLRFLYTGETHLSIDLSTHPSICIYIIMLYNIYPI